MASGLDENDGKPTESFSPRVTTIAKHIRNFDVIDDFSDHHFANTGQCFTSWDATREKTIFREWKILEDSLPDSIYVRVGGQNCNLMKAAIIGSSGTPYHDGLFFFDIFLPSEYPDMPPRVYYRSFGMELNPNLFPYGRVCLSLLNTWYGDSNEQWIPGKSTILQLLVSLQALVLNEKPFYNERKTSNIDYEDLSKSYNESVFVLSCKTMVSVLKNPPKGFEELVTLHFFDRSQVILTACQVYIHGFQKVGYYSEDQAFPEDNIIVSSYFKFSMKNTYKDLVAVFDKIDPASGKFRTKLNKKVKETEDKLISNRKTRSWLSLLKSLLLGPFYQKIIDLFF